MFWKRPYETRRRRLASLLILTRSFRFVFVSTHCRTRWRRRRQRPLPMEARPTRTRWRATAALRRPRPGTCPRSPRPVLRQRRRLRPRRRRLSERTRKRTPRRIMRRKGQSLLYHIFLVCPRCEAPLTLIIKKHGRTLLEKVRDLKGLSFLGVSCVRTPPTSNSS